MSVSPTNGNGPTQGQRKTLTRVGIEPTTFGLDHAPWFPTMISHHVENNRSILDQQAYHVNSPFPSSVQSSLQSDSSGNGLRIIVLILSAHDWKNHFHKRERSSSLGLIKRLKATRNGRFVCFVLPNHEFFCALSQTWQKVKYTSYENRKHCLCTKSCTILLQLYQWRVIKQRQRKLSVQLLCD